MSATIPPLPLSAYQPPCLSANLPINHEDNHDNLAIMQPHLQPVSYHSYQPSFLSAIIPHPMPRFWSLMFYFSGGLGCDKNNCNSWSFSTWSISLIINYWNPNKQFDMAQFLWIPFTMNPQNPKTPQEVWILLILDLNLNNRKENLKNGRSLHSNSISNNKSPEHCSEWKDHRTLIWNGPKERLKQTKIWG